MFKAIKALGQNFLLDKQIGWDMADALGVVEGDEVVEIGPGHGVVTEALADKVKNTSCVLYTVEIDERFIKKLVGKFSRDKNIKIIQDNILDYFPNFEPKGEFKIIGSLPYYITSPIIHSIIEMQKLPQTCVFLIQKEVGEKITSKSPDSSYLSVYIQTFFDVEYLFKVSRTEFKPEPKVDGGVIKLTKKDVNFNSEFKKKYRGFLHKGFGSPRKMLNKRFSKEELEKGGIDPILRPQNLSADEWLKFYKALQL